jgi:hypothetical protein
MMGRAGDQFERGRNLIRGRRLGGPSSA